MVPGAFAGRQFAAILSGDMEQHWTDLAVEPRGKRGAGVGRRDWRTAGRADWGATRIVRKPWPVPSNGGCRRGLIGGARRAGGDQP